MYINYVKNHYTLTKSNLNSNYKNIIHKKRKLKRYIDKLEQKKSINMYGGGHAMDKISKLNAIISTYNKLDSVSMENLNNLNEQIDTLLSKMKELKVPENIESLYNQDVISNNIETLKVSMTDFIKNNKINVERNKFTIPTLDRLKDDVNIAKIIDIVEVLEAEINTAIEKNEGDEIKYKKDIEELEKEISLVSDKITEKIQNYSSHIISLNKYITKLKNDIELELDLSNLKKIKSIQDIKKILNSKYPELPLTKELRDKTLFEAIDKYNSSSGKPKELPKKCFDGIYTKTIKNNLLFSDKDDRIFGLVRFDKFIESEVDYLSILKPNFVKEDGAEEKKEIEMYGGETKGVEEGEEEPDIIRKIKKLISKRDELSAVILEYNNTEAEYNTLYIRNIFHTMFVTMIITNQIIINNQINYKYINKGILQFFFRILDEINKRLDSGSMDNEIVYFRKYHFNTIKILHDFTSRIINEMDTLDVIDIDECKGNIAYGFHLLNNFKGILEAYYGMDAHKVTIYGRINDWGGEIKDKVFVSDFDRPNEIIVKKPEAKDLSKLYVQNKFCKTNTRADVDTIKFTEVFDTKRYANNGIISNYMAIQNTIMNGKGTAIMTYGYSGTGKTFTLFGKTDKDGNISEGMLQSILNNISGLKSIKFRLFELYGKGVIYPHYWNKGIENIEHKIYSYNIFVKNSNLEFGSEITNTINANDIKRFTNSDDDCITINAEDIGKIFRSFDVFTDKVEKHREDNKRVRETPNNPVSSRSMLLYDFRLIIEDIEEEIPFIIIDLAGREEIIETYVDTWMNRNNINNDLYKLLLSCLVLNPLALPTIYMNRDIKGIKTEFDVQIPDIIINEYLSLAKNERKILDKKPSNIIINGKSYEQNGTLLDDIINIENVRDNGEPFRLSFYFTMSKDNITLNNYGGMYSSKKYEKYFQYNALLSVHIMDRFINSNRFDLINKITNKIIDTYVNPFVINEFNYYDTPSEGIYINEVIISMIKYLENFTKAKETSVVNQDTDLDFITQQQDIRKWLVSRYKKDGTDKHKACIAKSLYKCVKKDSFNDRIPYLQYEEENIKTKIENIKQMYKSDRIFYPEEPIGEQILKPYMEKLEDYKIFYLFSNNKQELKCNHQIKLLNNTKSFIGSIMKIKD